MGNPTLKQDTLIETTKAAPAVVGTAASWITLNEGVALATILYVCVQTAYLVWKWRRDADNHKYNVSLRNEHED